ncbi:NodT family efflux transporter outer membrane factor (OMF) lipoprotein [Winogradskyella epiphytica]|uniref:NodT family efflux transporter outer membrane factor (OMF) lipoprotein n=1 Tax=Winogradskyella epiphytica TaxID=262005 RepID=A0A2V4XGV4_9FLAO|nr:efflux transporter outer membrane subunit [Winogradskyella epiphytica]PYE82731.1 NodT family efflux transporter outer membrane factor (OMF) lipoprotein [Winogradskyella epiphytica]
MKNTIIKFSSVIALMLTLQSCFVAKEYTQPELTELNIDEAKFRTDQISEDSLTLADVSWKTLFTDPVLTQYIEKGLENNIDIRVALQQIIASEAYFKQGKAGYYPTLGANASYMHQEPSENGQFGALGSSLDQYELSGALSWEADVWGKIRSNKRAFQARYLQTVAAHKAVKTRLIANIASVYYQLLSVDEQIKITEQTIITRENGLETSRALKEAGNVTEVGVKQTEAQLYTAQAILVDLKQQSHILENTLAILLGEMPQEMERSTLAEQEITTDLTLGVPSQLLSNRPDVVAAEFNLRNAFELTNVARSNFYPSLTLSANAGLQSLDIDNLFNANSLFANIIGGVAQPILNGRKIKTQYEVSQAQQEQARLNFVQSLLVASKEVSDAMYAYNSATERIEIKQKEFDAYEVATTYSEELLNNGLANYLEVLRAEENALNSSLGLVNAKNSQLQAIIDLYQALGGGWK